jgi:hypothetical protein
MQARRGRSLILGLMFGSLYVTARSAEVLADPPSDISVTVYRAPFRSGGSIDLAELNGFALVSETRTVHLPAGDSTLRFEGVADGIEAASSIVTGFPSGILEKNRDARLLSPAALISASVGKTVELLRTNRKTGGTERVSGTILSDADGGVVFSTAQGIEALRCSGLPETFSFTPISGLSTRPTLSVRVHSAQAITRAVTLSYLSSGFDWAADYGATLSADGKTLDLGAWVTLANSNGVGFPSAHTQVVAGKLNRETGEVEPLDTGEPIIATCWPRGSTSDSPPPMFMARARSLKFESANAPAAARAFDLNAAIVVTASKVQQEQLGDLKLYRIPDRTTVASRQSKQVRLMDRSHVPYATVYGADIDSTVSGSAYSVYRLLRTKNSAANHLGLPLPSGRIAVFSMAEGQRLLEHESDLRDLAVEEELEIKMGSSADVQVSVSKESSAIDTAHAQALPLVPGVALRSAKVDDVSRVSISNAHDADIQFELRVQLPDGATIVRADRPMGKKNGRPVFKLSVPANGNVTVRYQSQQTQTSAVSVR